MRSIRATRPISALPPLIALRESVLVVLAALAYFAVRGLVDGQEARAFANARRIIRVEEWLGIFVEVDLQEVVATRDFLIDFANWIYIWGHWPVIAAVALFLMLSRPEGYYRYRNAFFISGGIGLVVFALFPVAPPRLLDAGLVDTITERSEAYRLLQPPQLVNQFAAMPSLHFGWNLLIGMAIVQYGRWPIVRAVGIVLPVAMGVAVVATANHFILDPIAGAIVALGGLWLADHGLPTVRRRLRRGRARD